MKKEFRFHPSSPCQYLCPLPNHLQIYPYHPVGLAITCSYPVKICHCALMIALFCPFQLMPSLPNPLYLYLNHPVNLTFLYPHSVKKRNSLTIVVYPVMLLCLVLFLTFTLSTAIPLPCSPTTLPNSAIIPSNIFYPSFLVFYLAITNIPFPSPCLTLPTSYHPHPNPLFTQLHPLFLFTIPCSANTTSPFPSSCFTLPKPYHPLVFPEFSKP